MRREDADLVAAATFRLYGAGQPIWDPSDRWNSYKRRAIDRFARGFVGPLISPAAVILDLGCGSQAYDWLPPNTVSLDRYFEQARNNPTPVVGDIEQLPFRTSVADFVVCVASVINYVSAAEAIAEFKRVLKPGGTLLLHFETSTSFERLGGKDWGAPVVRIETLNSGREDTIWAYRPSYILSLLRSSGFSVVRQHRFHILSALALRLGFNQQIAARFAALDRVCAALASLSDDVILIAERTEGELVEVPGGPQEPR
jgi:SAM-dependent methyltransferase